jgi:hypothetical protein
LRVDGECDADSDAASIEAPSSGSTDLSNNPYSGVDLLADEAWTLARQAVESHEENLISDAAVAKLLTAAVKLYAAKADRGERSPRALLGDYDEVVSPTEALTAATELLRALRLGPMEFGLWARRRPEDYHDQSQNEPVIPVPDDG